MTTTIAAHESFRPATDSLPQTPRTEKRPQYLFIHTVRFWAIMALICLHSGNKFANFQPVSTVETTLLVQPFKFGTIAFFIISGFLLGDRLPSSNPFAYIRRRAARLVPAWALWYILWVLYSFIGNLRRSHAEFSPRVIGPMLYSVSVWCLVETLLWFVPNFLVALTCIVLLRKWLNSLWLGAALLAVSAFYGVNVYTEWLPSRHTEAVFGFVFYLWLGAWCALRKDRVQAWAEARSPWWLSFWAFVAASAATWEMTFLRAHNRVDPMNTLRPANQIYSVLMVILLIRIRRRTWPAFVNVGETTYGVYLTHGIIINLVFTVAMRTVVHGHQLGAAAILLMWLLVVPTVYLLSLQLTRALASSERWGWAVGAAKFEPRKWISQSALPNGALPTEA